MNFGKNTNNKNKKTTDNIVFAKSGLNIVVENSVKVSAKMLFIFLFLVI